MASPDTSLIDRVRRGDRDAIVQFVEEHRTRLLAYIDRSLGSALRRKIEPDDILQEVMISALRAPEQDLAGGRDPFGWLCQLSEQRIIDAHRRFVAAQKRSTEREVSLGSPASESRPAALIEMLVASITSPSEAFSRDQREFRLLQAMSALPEESREALRLRYVEGLPTKQIAQQLGKTDGAIRVMLTRAINRLQAILDENEKQDG